MPVYTTPIGSIAVAVTRGTVGVSRINDGAETGAQLTSTLTTGLFGSGSTPYVSRDDVSVSGSGYVTLDIGTRSNEPAGFTPNPVIDELQSVIVNLAAHSNLTITDEMAFGTLVVQGLNQGRPVSGTTTTLNGLSVIVGGAVTLATSNVSGNGTLLLQAAATNTGIISSSGIIKKAAGAGVNIALQGTGNHASSGGGSLTLDDPQAFAGVVTFNAGANFLVLAGLAATSYSMKGEILSLFNGNRLVDTLRIADPAAAMYAQLAPGTPPLSFQHNSQGVVIGNGGEASSQPGGIGTPLVLHA